MAKTLIIGTSSFDFPIAGEAAGWGESVTDWAEAVSDALSTVQQPNDLVSQSGTIANNQASPSSIAGFSFDTSEVVAINAEYIVKRRTDSPANNLVENGYIKGNFDGVNWSISQEYVGDAQVEFTITSGGQLQYTSSLISGTNYSGSITFKAKVFNDV